MKIKQQDKRDSKKRKSKMPKDPKEREMRKKRKNVVAEIISTERTYCTGLKKLVVEYLLPIKHEGFTTLSEKNAKIIFSNIETINSVQQELLKSLEASEKNLAKAFSKLMPFLHVYREYCANYYHASNTFKQKMENNTKFANFVNKTQIENANQDFLSMLVLPIQRIPRYRLLFVEVIKYTPETDPELPDLKQVLHDTEQMAEFVNESIRARENQEKIAEIQSTFVGKAPDFLEEPDRRVYRDGFLVKLCRREPKKRYFILFSDQLVYAAPLTDGVIGSKDAQFKFHRGITLSSCAVSELEDTDVMRNAFQILSNEKSFTVFANSHEDKVGWIRDIKDAVQEYANQNLTEEERARNEVAPVWVPDKLQKHCIFCDTKFTTINRRHHCRKCGALCCGDCSSHKFKLENLGKVVRVCDVCFEQLSGTKVPPKKGKQRVVSEIITKKEVSEKRTENENESRANLARRATLMLSKKTEGSTTNIPNFRKGASQPVDANSVVNTAGKLNSSVEDISEASETETETEQTDSAKFDVSDTESDTPVMEKPDPLAKFKEKKPSRRHSSRESKRKTKKRTVKKKRSTSSADGTQSNDKEETNNEDENTKPRYETTKLVDWTEEDVLAWIEAFEKGRFKKFMTEFEGLTGRDLSMLTEKQITATIPGLKGAALYNSFQLLKQQNAAQFIEAEDAEASATKKQTLQITSSAIQNAFNAPIQGADDDDSSSDSEGYVMAEDFDDLDNLPAPEHAPPPPPQETEQPVPTSTDT